MALGVKNIAGLPCRCGFNFEFFTHFDLFRDPHGRAFLLPVILSKMRNKSQTTPIAPNIMALLSTPQFEVDPITEIQSIYHVDMWTACDIYETVGEDYANENMVACLCSVASPAYLETLKGDLSC